MKITQIKTYRLPIEGNRLDRYIGKTPAEVDAFINDKLQETFIPTDKKFTWEFTSPSASRITITSDKRVNYLRIESSIFPDKQVSYWFLTSTEEWESSKAMKYNARLDVMATYGFDFLNTMKGKKLEIKRWHEDRYLVEDDGNNGKKLVINKNNIALLNSDFKTGNMIGDKVSFSKAFDGTGGDVLANTARLLRGKSVIGGATGITQDLFASIEIDNRHYLNRKLGAADEMSNETWYKYAIVEYSGEPSTIWIRNGLNWEAKNIAEYVDSIDNDNDLRRKLGIGIDRFRFLMPIGTIKYDNKVWVNSISQLQNLPEGKVVSVFYSPIKYFSSLSIETDPINNLNSYFLFGDILGENDAKLKTIPTTTTQIESDRSETIFDIFSDDPATLAKYKIKLMLGLFLTQETLNDGAGIRLSESDWNGLLKLEKTGTPQELKDFLKEKYSEVGLFNGSIISQELSFKGTDERIVVEPYDYLSKDVARIQFTCNPDASGIFLNVNVADKKYYDLIIDTNTNIITDSAKNYINNNRHSIDAQREGVRLQERLQREQLKSQRNQSIANAANPLSAIFSVGTSTTANAMAASSFNAQRQMVSDIADNNIRKIDANISDMQAQAPIVKSGGSNIWKLAGTLETPWKVSYMVKVPNDVILENIYNHYNKFGYKTDKWVQIENSETWWKSRKLFNFLQIDNVKDYYNGELNVDDSIVDLFEDELKVGVRIWHQKDIIYNNENIEIKVDELN